MKGRLLALTLILVVVSVGCASLPRIPNLPEQLPAADTHVITVAGNLQQLLTLTAEVANTVSRIEDEAARNGAIPAAIDARFDAAALAYVEASDRASRGLANAAVLTWPQMRALVEPVLVRGQALIDVAQSAGTLRTRAQAWLAQMRDLLTAAVGQFATGGVR